MTTGSFPVAAEPFDRQHPHYPSSLPPLHNPPSSSWPRRWRRGLQSKRFPAFVAVTIFLLIILGTVLTMVLRKRSLCSTPPAVQINVSIGWAGATPTTSSSTASASRIQSITSTSIATTSAPAHKGDCLDKDHRPIFGCEINTAPLIVTMDQSGEKPQTKTQTF
jgi:hypothetical protein